MFVEWFLVFCLCFACFVLGVLLRPLRHPIRPAIPTPGAWRKLNGRARIMEQLESTICSNRVHGWPMLAYHLRLPCETGGPRLYVVAEGEELCFEVMERLEKLQRGQPKRQRRLVCACGREFLEMEDLRHHQAECPCQEQTA